MPPGGSLEMMRVGEEEDIFLLSVFLVFGLWNDVVLQLNILIVKQNIITANDGSDERPIAKND